MVCYQTFWYTPEMRRLSWPISSDIKNVIQYYKNLIHEEDDTVPWRRYGTALITNTLYSMSRAVRGHCAYKDSCTQTHVLLMKRPAASLSTFTIASSRESHAQHQRADICWRIDLTVSSSFLCFNVSKHYLHHEQIVPFISLEVLFKIWVFSDISPHVFHVLWPAASVWLS